MLHRIQRLLVACIGLIGLVLPTFATFTSALAQISGPPGDSKTRDALVSIDTAIAEPNTPAVITIDVGAQALPTEALLELLVEPVLVSDEQYLIVLALGGQGTADASKQIGLTSFYPPPVAGVSRSLFFDLAPVLEQSLLTGQTRYKLSIALVSNAANRVLSRSALRVIGARITANHG